MRDLFRVAEIVEEILETSETARKDDHFLYFKVCEKLNGEALDTKLGDFLLTVDSFDLPRFESVGRARRKLQAENPKLRPAEDVQRKRYERAIDYIFFSKGNNINERR